MLPDIVLAHGTSLRNGLTTGQQPSNIGWSERIPSKMRSFVAKHSVCEEPRMVRRLCLALALCLAFVPFGAAAQTAPVPAPATIRLGVITVEAAAEAFYAVDMGFFKKQGLDV